MTLNLSYDCEPLVLGLQRSSVKKKKESSTYLGINFVRLLVQVGHWQRKLTVFLGHCIKQVFPPHSDL